jgi:hypothetical protein
MTEFIWGTLPSCTLPCVNGIRPDCLETSPCAVAHSAVHDGAAEPRVIQRATPSHDWHARCRTGRENYERCTQMITKFSVAGRSTLNANFGVAQKPGWKSICYWWIRYIWNCNLNYKNRIGFCTSWNVAELPGVRLQNKCTEIVNRNLPFRYTKRCIQDLAFQVCWNGYWNSSFHNTFHSNWNIRFRFTFQLELICKLKLLHLVKLKFGRRIIRHSSADDLPLIRRGSAAQVQMVVIFQILRDIRSKYW